MCETQNTPTPYMPKIVQPLVWVHSARERFAYRGGNYVGRVTPWHLPEGRYVYCAEIRLAQGVRVLGDYDSPDAAVTAIEAEWESNNA